MRLLRWLRSLLARRQAPTPAAPPAVPPYVAPAVSCVHGVVSHQNAGELDGLKDLGAPCVRVTYFTEESAQVNADWAWKLPLFDAAGIELLTVVHDFRTPADIVPTMVALTTRFPGRRWQVGNEYNAHPWKAQQPAWGAASMGGAWYARLMREVLWNCPQGRFVGMGLAHGTDHAGFLRDYLAAGGPTLEAWCIHCYGVPVAIDKPVQATHAVLQGRMPLWITEYGINRADQEKAWGPLSRQYVDDEAARTVWNVTQAAGALGVARAYWYCYWDNQDDAFGLVRRDGSHRPAWRELQQVAAT